LSAKAVRHGEEVHLADDMKQTTGSEAEKSEKESNW